jgi:bacterial/archaeal transporter family-2 protein
MTGHQSPSTFLFLRRSEMRSFPRRILQSTGRSRLLLQCRMEYGSVRMRFLPILVMVMAGFFISIQGPLNARLRHAVESPVLTAAISFLSGGLILLCIMVTGAFGGIGTGFRGMQSAPLWAYLGGALGVSFVLGSIIAIPKVGVVVVICAAILGQMVGSYLADTFGWFGVERVPFNPVRVAGMGLLLIGVLLVQRK